MSTSDYVIPPPEPKEVDEKLSMWSLKLPSIELGWPLDHTNGSFDKTMA